MGFHPNRGGGEVVSPQLIGSGRSGMKVTCGIPENDWQLPGMTRRGRPNRVNRQACVAILGGFMKELPPDTDTRSKGRQGEEPFH